MLFLRTSNLQWATIRPIVPRQKHSIVFIVHHQIFFRARSFKNEDLQLLFLTFQDEALESRNVSNESKPHEKLTEYNKRNKTRQETD